MTGKFHPRGHGMRRFTIEVDPGNWTGGYVKVLLLD